MDFSASILVVKEAVCCMLSGVSDAVSVDVATLCLVGTQGWIGVATKNLWAVLQQVSIQMTHFSFVVLLQV